MNDPVITALFESTSRAVTPVLLAAVGGVLSARAGIFNIALEGMMLWGAFGAVAGSYFTSNWAVGLGVGVCVGTLAGVALALTVVRFRGEPMVVGLAMNLLAVGGTALLLRQFWEVSGIFDSPEIVGLPPLHLPLVGSVPILGPLLDGQSPLVLTTLFLVLLTHVVLFKHRWGLRLRGAGEHPEAAQSLGVPVRRYQMAALIASGALCGLAGVQLALSNVTLFAQEMSAGRGWIAVVAVMLGRESPLGVLAACLLFGLAEAIGFRLQGAGLPSQFTDVGPYVVTLVALVAVAYRNQRSERVRAAAASTGAAS